MLVGSDFKRFVESLVISEFEWTCKLSNCSFDMNAIRAAAARAGKVTLFSTPSNCAFLTVARSASTKITAESKCVGCEGIGAPLQKEEVELQRSLLIPDWETNVDGTRLSRTLELPNFAIAMHYLNQVAAIAEAEQHHPDMTVRQYNHVDIVLWTHALGGITENDLIMAVKIDTIPIPQSHAGK